ncbi:endo alpha-1,4 polygalactosaminidase [Actinomadura atramentaria]|uniref:endo alpha-1,4 polygalactosaminidase n=1 Tax=Actinomadura atramentaria TaxID=1990 RepID=UPI0003806004|nr:endo alpha-1,4 polygalactosaminidase [Actinomadura atramentaria]
MHRLTRVRVLVLAVALVAAACSSCGEPDRTKRGPAGGGSSTGASSGAGSGGSGPAVRPPPPGIAFDYQIGGPYPPPPGVRAVSRDRTAAPAPGLYNVCYVNAFQTQPDAVRWWRENHPDLLLTDRAGRPVIDRDWNEPLLDISTAAHRTALAAIVGSWTDGCATAGFNAVEFDNLDSYQRSDDLLTAADAVAFARLITARAHEHGLAAAQKNTAELLPHRAVIGFDLAVVEECGRTDECAEYATAYPNRVFDIEYDAKGFTAACRSFGTRIAVTRRDRDVLPTGTPGHRYRACTTP